LRRHAWYAILPFVSWFINSFSDNMVAQRHLMPWLLTCLRLFFPSFCLIHFSAWLTPLSLSPSLSLCQSAWTTDMDSYITYTEEDQQGADLATSYKGYKNVFCLLATIHGSRSLYFLTRTITFI
jgi:hypothetical protein